jgi:hypothetical protein
VDAALPIAIIGATAVKVTWISGNLTPTFQKPTDWIMEAMPHVKRSALINWTSCSFESPIAAARRQQYDHSARVKCQHMLEPINCQTRRRKNLVHGVDGAGGFESCRNTFYVSHLLIPFRKMAEHPSMNRA